MLHVASVCTPCCMLLDVVACCCAKFETGQTFQTTPNISFVPWSPKVGQQYWIRCTVLPYSSSNVVGATHAYYAWIPKTYGLYFPTMHCRSQTCWELLHPLHTTANTHATTPNIVGAIMLVVVPPVCTQPKQRRRRGQRNRHKSSSFRLAKQFCTCITLFCTFLSRHCTTTPWKCLISRFVEDVNTRQRRSSSFSELWYRLRSHSTGRIFDRLRNLTGHFVHPEPFNTFAPFTRNCRTVIV